MSALHINEAEVLTIAHGDYSAEIATFGGGIKALTYQGRALVETYGDKQFPPLAAGVILAPWPNRTEDGLFTVDGVEHQLAITEPERNHAIHGLVHESVWDVLTHEASHCILTTTIHPQQGWPWEITIQAHYQLDANGLSAQFTAHTDSSASTVPFGFGWHTYLSAQGADVDTTTLTVNVDKQQQLSADRLIPIGEPEQTPTARQLSEGLPMADVQLDDCFLSSSAHPMVTTLVNNTGTGVKMVCDETLKWHQIFTPDPATGTGYPGRGRTVAVEPMTCPPNALRTGTDIINLSPMEGEGLTLSVLIHAIGTTTS